MAIKIVIASGKGGVGKSTLAVGIARAMTERNMHTLLVDTDIALNSLDVLMFVANKVVYNWVDIIENRCEPLDALLEINDYMSLLAAPTNLTQDISSYEISELLYYYEEYFDYILIDAPAGIGNGFLRAVSAADAALVVATPDALSVKAAATVADILQEQKIKEVRLVVNRFKKKAAKKCKLLSVDNVIDEAGSRLIGIIPEDENIVYSTVTGKKVDSKSSAGKAFGRITERLLGKNIPLVISQLK